MQEKHETPPVIEREFNKTERTLIRLYRMLPQRDRWYLRKVLLVMIRAARKQR